MGRGVGCTALPVLAADLPQGGFRAVHLAVAAVGGLGGGPGHACPQAPLVSRSSLRAVTQAQPAARGSQAARSPAAAYFGAQQMPETREPSRRTSQGPLAACCARRVFRDSPEKVRVRLSPRSGQGLRAAPGLREAAVELTLARASRRAAAVKLRRRLWEESRGWSRPLSLLRRSLPRSILFFVSKSAGKRHLSITKFLLSTIYYYSVNPSIHGLGFQSWKHIAL